MNVCIHTASLLYASIDHKLNISTKTELKWIDANEWTDQNEDEKSKRDGKKMQTRKKQMR